MVRDPPQSILARAGGFSNGLKVQNLRRGAFWLDDPPAGGLNEGVGHRFTCLGEHVIMSPEDRIRELEAERDLYLKALYALTRKEVTITAEEIADLDQNGIPLSDIIAELKEDQAR
jgi:hypothetical protein